MRFTIPLATITVAALAHGAAASPDSHADLFLSVVPPTGDGAPQIEATIVDGPNLPLDKIQLVDGTGLRIGATSMRSFKDGPDAVSLALVIAGSEVQMGNTSITDDRDPSRFPGYLPGVVHALDALDLAHSLPAGSRGMLITYDEFARVRVPMGSIAHLTSAELGTERDYYGKLGTNMVEAIQIAVRELSESRSALKVLIVIGDGNDTNNEAAKPALALLTKRAAQEGIRTFSLIYKSVVSSEDNVITQMVPASQMLSSSDGVAAALQGVMARVTNRATVRFPGDQLAWDGASHKLTVQLGTDQLDPVAVVLTDRRSHARYNPFGSWWFRIAMGLGGVGVIALLLRWRAARAAT